MMTRNDTRPLKFFSRENFETFRATYFFMAMCALSLLAFAFAAKLGVSQGTLFVPLAAATFSMACVFATFFISPNQGSTQTEARGHTHVQPRAETLHVHRSARLHRRTVP